MRHVESEVAVARAAKPFSDAVIAAMADIQRSCQSTSDWRLRVSPVGDAFTYLQMINEVAERDGIYFLGFHVEVDDGLPDGEWMLEPMDSAKIN